jgi:PAS domain S-box-containing protein
VLRRLGEPAAWFTCFPRLALFALVALLAPIASATPAAVLVTLLGNDGVPFAQAWSTWYTSEALGLLLVVPFLLSWTDPALRRDLPVRKVLEAAGLAALVLVAAAFIFTQEHLQAKFLVFPFLLLATFRGGLPAAAAGAVALACVAIWCTGHGHGPIAAVVEADTAERLQVLKLYLATVVLSTLPVAATLAQRERARREAGAASAALLGERKRLDLALDAANASAWDWDPAADRSVWSSQMFDLLGLDPATTTPSFGAMLGVVHPEDAPPLRAAMYEDRETWFREEFRIVHPTRGLRWINGLGRPRARTGRAAVVRGSGVNIDVTRRKRAEERLRAGEERFRQLANRVPAFVWFTDANGRVLHINDRWYEYTGQTPEQALSYGTIQAAHPDDVGRMLATWDEAARRGVPWEIEFRCRRRDGAYRWYMARIEPLRDEAGRTTGWFGASTDVHDRRLAEEGSRAAKEAAEAARAEAEAANRAKSDFLAAMSHEVRTPLAAVLGMADLLGASPGLPRAERARVEAIRTAGRHLLDVVNDVLDFARVEAGRLRLERVDLAPARLLEEVRSLLAPRAVERGLTLELRPGPGLPAAVRGDPTRLRQVLLNLVGNALKFTHEGGVGVAASGRAEGDGRVRLRFEVRDTGIGVARERQAALFEAFTQADASATRRYGGSGLGLAISKRLVEAMGGEIGVESAPGVGSLFWFEVPLEPGDPAAAEAAGDGDPGAARRGRCGCWRPRTWRSTATCCARCWAGTGTS